MTSYGPWWGRQGRGLWGRGSFWHNSDLQCPHSLLPSTLLPFKAIPEAFPDHFPLPLGHHHYPAFQQPMGIAFVQLLSRLWLCNPIDCSTPDVCSNSCPLSGWCYLIISSSATSFSFCLKSFPASGLLQWCSSHQVAKALEFQLQRQSFQWISRTDFLQDWLLWSPCSPRDS